MCERSIPAAPGLCGGADVAVTADGSGTDGPAERHGSTAPPKCAPLHSPLSFPLVRAGSLNSLPRPSLKTPSQKAGVWGGDGPGSGGSGNISLCRLWGPLWTCHGLPHTPPCGSRLCLTRALLATPGAGRPGRVGVCPPPGGAG